MPEARLSLDFGFDRLIAAAAVGVGEVWQLADGRAAVYDRLAGNSSNPAIAAAAGEGALFRTAGQFTFTLTAGVTILDGGRVYWDYSANSATYRKVNDRDFYLGRARGDSSSGSVVVDINVDPRYDIDVALDPTVTAIVGTQSLNVMGLFRRGGAHKFLISSTNEAQKIDILSKDGFAKNANAIIEFAIEVVNGGAGGAPDVSIGVANATHATDADSITDAIFLHLNGSDVNLYFESDDGTTEVAATDSTLDYTAGTRFEVWIDMRNPADVQIYVNAALVLGSTVFNVDASVATWKLLAHIEKTAAADVLELDLEWLRARFAEQ